MFLKLLEFSDKLLSRGVDPLKNNPHDQSPFSYLWIKGLMNDKERATFMKALQHVSNTKGADEPVMHTMTAKQLEGAYAHADKFSLMAPCFKEGGLSIEEFNKAMELAETTEDKKMVLEGVMGASLVACNSEVFDHAVQEGADVDTVDDGYNPLMLICANLAGQKLIASGREESAFGSMPSDLKPIRDIKDPDDMYEVLKKNPLLKLSKITKSTQVMIQRSKELAEKYPALFTYGFIPSANNVDSTVRRENAEAILDKLLTFNYLSFDQDKQGYTVFDYAAIANDTVILDKLMSYRQHHDMADEDLEMLGKALQNAGRHGCLNAQSWLVHHGAKVQSLPKEECDKLCAGLYRSAQRESNFDLLQQLFGQGVSPNLIVYNGKKQHTLLHKAARDGDNDIVEFLIKQDGIKLDAKDRQGKTAEDLAEEGSSIKETLKEARVKKMLAAPLFVPQDYEGESSCWNPNAQPFVMPDQEG